MAEKTIHHLTIKLRIAHTCVNLAYAALIGVLTIWAFFHDAGFSGAGFSPVLWAIVCIPLLILWPSMRKKRYRAYSWLCFVILLYFIKAVEGSMSSVASWIDFSILTLSVIIFVSAMLTSRWLQYSQIQSNHSLTDKEKP